MRRSAYRRLVLTGVLVGAGASLAWFLARTYWPSGPGSATGLAALSVAPGFEVTLAAGSDLASYAMMGTVDDRGRLFLCESSGMTVETPEMTANPTYRIRVLTDRDGDGVYDEATIFADRLTLPAGAVWHRGALYVAAPPDLLRFEDTDGDGVADRRDVVVTGWNLSANAASLHGPIMGPDGWLYLTDGRHGFDIVSQEGVHYKGRASRIWRVRPDGTGLEWFAGGGFDNPVEVVFTPAGEVIGTMTYFTDPKAGERDALLHFVEGGVYPKPHPTIEEFKRTGELMPVMTRFARIAPSGLLRYRGRRWGPDWEGNLFSAQFNTHRVQRHELSRAGATFATRDEDFLASTDPDFHPTDVVEHPDGSLLVIDTGAWFIHGCPISRIAKPEVKGGIYRIRKKGARPLEDGLGQNLDLAALSPAQLTGYLEDERYALRDRVADRLAETGAPAVEALAAFRRQSRDTEARAAAVFVLGRIGGEPALEAVRAALEDAGLEVRIAAARVLGMARDRAAIEPLAALARTDKPAVRRQAATALGQIGDPAAAAALLEAAATAEDRFVEHAIIHSLLTLGHAPRLSASLGHPHPGVRKAALIALDQMDASPIRLAHALPLISDPDPDLRRAALWVAGRHPDWSASVLSALAVRLRSGRLDVREAAVVTETLTAYCPGAPLEALFTRLMRDPAFPPERRPLVLEVIGPCSPRPFPQAWIEPLGAWLRDGAPELRGSIVELIEASGLGAMDAQLEVIAADSGEAPGLRVAACSALAARWVRTPAPLFDYLVSLLASSKDAALRLSASHTLARAPLDEHQLLRLAREAIPAADPLILANLLDAFRAAGDTQARRDSRPARQGGETHTAGQPENLGQALFEALAKPSTPVEAAGAQRIERLMERFPAQREAGDAVLARMRASAAERAARMARLEPLLEGGDPGRGRAVFFGEKTGCAGCHTIGQEGEHVGPDLTSVGIVRSGHDILEAIVFPSETYVPGYEIVQVETRAGMLHSGVMDREARASDTVVLRTGPKDRVRIPKSEVVKTERAPVSLMPDGFDEVLTPAELADLLAFLQAQGVPQPSRDGN